ncbi:Hypothetical_protein [Hexamita inflata]|uniref:Hypothetical_protein n=1 Tax=Hexamita inflata TaxID=28002 RepID=A0AA86N4F0_9EUKA|nr:Hypothetical protein HINF_LOCUS19 [Hexamita inflata]
MSIIVLDTRYAPRQLSVMLVQLKISETAQRLFEANTFSAKPPFCNSLNQIICVDAMILFLRTPTHVRFVTSHVTLKRDRDIFLTVQVDLRLTATIQRQQRMDPNAQIFASRIQTISYQYRLVSRFNITLVASMTLYLAVFQGNQEWLPYLKTRDLPNTATLNRELQRFPPFEQETGCICTFIYSATYIRYDSYVLITNVQNGIGFQRNNKSQRIRVSTFIQLGYSIQESYYKGTASLYNISKSEVQQITFQITSLLVIIYDYSHPTIDNSLLLTIVDNKTIIVINF